MDPCHIAQFLHLVTPQGVRRRDVIDCISCSHLYYLDLQTHPTYYCNHSHRLHTYTYPSVSVNTDSLGFRRTCTSAGGPARAVESFQNKQLLDIGATFDDFS